MNIVWVDETQININNSRRKECTENSSESFCMQWIRMNIDHIQPCTYSKLLHMQSFSSFKSRRSDLNKKKYSALYCISDNNVIAKLTSPPHCSSQQSTNKSKQKTRYDLLIMNQPLNHEVVIGYTMSKASQTSFHNITSMTQQTVVTK